MAATLHPLSLVSSPFLLSRAPPSTASPTTAAHSTLLPSAIFSSPSSSPLPLSAFIASPPASLAITNSWLDSHLGPQRLPAPSRPFVARCSASAAGVHNQPRQATHTQPYPCSPMHTQSWLRAQMHPQSCFRTRMRTQSCLSTRRHTQSCLLACQQAPPKAVHSAAAATQSAATHSTDSRPLTLACRPFFGSRAPLRPMRGSTSGEGRTRGRGGSHRCLALPDPWAPGASQSIASQLFAFSLFPYLGFLFHLHRSNTAPKLTLFGFYFLLVFVAATIPAGIYAKLHYGTSLSNVDYLHGGAELFLTLTNLFIVIGLRDAIRAEEHVGEEEEVPADVGSGGAAGRGGALEPEDGAEREAGVMVGETEVRKP